MIYLSYPTICTSQTVTGPGKKLLTGPNFWICGSSIPLSLTKDTLVLKDIIVPKLAPYLS